jgi:hypothetical protein
MQQNFLSPTGFRLSIKRLPNVSFFIQAATIPGISMTAIDYPTPFKNLEFAGSKINFEQFTVNIRVDENMDSYNEIFNWMVGLAPTKSFDQYNTLKKSEYGLYSDASLIILNSRQNPALEVVFRDIFPVSLSSIALDTTQSTINYVSCDVTFGHNGYQINTITS